MSNCERIQKVASSYSRKSLRETKQFLRQCAGSGITDIQAIIGYLTKRIDAGTPVTSAVVAKRKDNPKGLRCPSCKNTGVRYKSCVKLWMCRCGWSSQRRPE